jgi:uncharacterized protein (DUF433 family)
MDQRNIEKRDGGYWIQGTRISLDSIVYALKRGATPEEIQQSFPLLMPEEIEGAIAFYLTHEQEIDTYLEQAEGALEAQSRAWNTQARDAKPDLFRRLEQARQARKTPR